MVESSHFIAKTTSAFDHHCSWTLPATNKVPEGQARHHGDAVLRQRMAGEQLPPKPHTGPQETGAERLCCLIFLQARKLLRELKHQKRCEEAATTIAAYWHGTQVESGREGLLLTFSFLTGFTSVFLFETWARLLFLPNGTNGVRDSSPITP